MGAELLSAQERRFSFGRPQTPAHRKTLTEGLGSMGENEPDRAPAGQTQADESTLHVASGQDATDARHRADRLAEILDRGDARDRAAERRDRAAEGRDVTDSHGATVDRDWSGRDRDKAAEDRADLIELLQSHEPETPGDAGDLLLVAGVPMAEQAGPETEQRLGGMTRSAIDEAKGILMARNRCTREEAFSALRTAATRNELSIDELAACLVAYHSLG